MSFLYQLENDSSRSWLIINHLRLSSFCLYGGRPDEQQPIDKHVEAIIAYLILLLVAVRITTYIFIDQTFERRSCATTHSDVRPKPLKQIIVNVFQLTLYSLRILFKLDQFFWRICRLKQSLNPINDIELDVVYGCYSAVKVVFFVERRVFLDGLNVRLYFVGAHLSFAQFFSTLGA